MGKKLLSAVLLVLVTCLAQVDSKYYKLPTSIIPHHYDLIFILKNNCFNEKTYQGVSDIHFKVIENTNMIILHASRLKIESIKITKDNAVLAHKSFVLNESRRLLTIDMSQELAVGDDYKVNFKYIGELLDNSSFGLYQSSYKDPNGDTHHFASTYFNHTYARRAFPCFDEPQLKATFNLTLTHPLNLNAIANTATKSSTLIGNNLTVSTFHKTPKMSTYLLSFTISDFTLKENDLVRTWAKIGTENRRHFALNLTSQLIEKLNEFTGIPFESHGLGKLDVVAIPNFKMTAMENWGIINVHELFLLDNENDTNNFDILAIAQMLALEFARGWFGNLVTVKYWTDVWLGKGFATYYQFMALNSIFPDWSMDKRLIITAQHKIFQIDGSIVVPPLDTNVESLDDICLHLKGASIVNMMAHMLGDKFHSGIKKYLKDNSFKNVVSQNLFDAFEAQSPSNLPKNKTFGEVMNNWITKPGYPVVKVSQFDNHIHISQERFVYQYTYNNDHQVSWYIPITFTKQSDEHKFNNTLPQYWLTPDENLTIPLTLNDEWIVFNNLESGYYRVNYDDSLWNKIINALKVDLNQIPDLNRAQLVDDIFSLCYMDRVSCIKAIQLFEYLANETNYFVWVTAFDNFKFAIDRTKSSAIGRAISSKLLSLMRALLDSVPLSRINLDDQIYTFNQVQAHQMACELGDKNCIKHAVEQFELFRTKIGKKPISNFRFFTYCTALRHSLNSTRDWQFLYGEYVASKMPVEIEILLLALGCTRNETILLNYLEKATTPNGTIPKDKVMRVFDAVIHGNPEGPKVAYKFLTNNYNGVKYYLREVLDPTTLLELISTFFNTQYQVDQLEEFVKSQTLTVETRGTMNRAIHTAQNIVNWLHDLRNTLNDILHIHED